MPNKTPVAVVSRWLRRYVGFVIRHRAPVIVTILIATAFFASRIMNLKIDMDPDLWAPQSSPYVQATKKLEESFGGRGVILIGIVPKQGDIFRPEILSKVQAIQKGIERIPQAIRHNILSLAAPQVKDIKGTTEGMEVRPMMGSLPPTADEAARIREAVFSNPIYVKAIVSEDGKAAGVIADFNIPKDNPTFTPIYRDIRALTDKQKDENTDIYLGGLPIELAWFEHYMMKMPVYFGIALIIIMGIQYWSFRSFQGMILPMVTALLSVVWSLGIMGLLGVHMDGMNTSTPILIMAVAAGHATQILKRYYEEFHRLQTAGPPAGSAREVNDAAIIESLTRVGPVMITASLIAMITFFSLSTADISVIRHFGIFAGSGVLCAMVLEITFIPAIRSILSPPKAREAERERREGWLDRLLRSLAYWLTSGRAPWILALALALIGLAFSGVFRLHTDNSMKNYNQKGSEVRRDDDALNRLFGGTNSIFFLVEGSAQDSIKDPRVLQGMQALQSFLDRQPHVGKTQSVVDLLKQMNQAMHAGDPAFYVLPDRRDLITQYLFVYSISGDPQDFDSFVDNDYRNAVIWVYLKEDSTAYTEALYKEAQQVIADNFPAGVTVQMGGSLPLTIAINEALTQGKFKNMLQMSLAVFILSSLALRSFVGGLFVVTPLLAVILANFGLMGWMNVPLDMGTAATAVMAIGIGADYEIYLLFRFREEWHRTKDLSLATRDSLLTSGKAILFVALSIAGGYSILLLSGFGFYTRLSVMVISTMVVSVLSALLFLRAMMVIFKPKFIFGTPDG